MCIWVICPFPLLPQNVSIFMGMLYKSGYFCRSVSAEAFASYGLQRRNDIVLAMGKTKVRDTPICIHTYALWVPRLLSWFHYWHGNWHAISACHLFFIKPEGVFIIVWALLRPKGITRNIVAVYCGYCQYVCVCVCFDPLLKSLWLLLATSPLRLWLLMTLLYVSRYLYIQNKSPFNPKNIKTEFYFYIGINIP